MSVHCKVLKTDIAEGQKAQIREKLPNRSSGRCQGEREKEGDRFLSCPFPGRDWLPNPVREEVLSLLGVLSFTSTHSPYTTACFMILIMGPKGLLLLTCQYMSENKIEGE